MTEPPGPPAELPEVAQAAVAAEALRRVTRSTRRASKTPRRSTPAFSNDRDPAALGSSIERLVNEKGWQDRSAVALLLGQWPRIVGPELAEHVTPGTFEDGVLVLQTDSTAWATQLRLLLPEVHRTIDAHVGSGVVERIRIIGPQAPSWTAGQRRVKGRGPRDTYG